MKPSPDTYQITRYPGGIEATGQTVRKIKELIVNGTRSFPVRRKASEIVSLVDSRDTTGEIEQVYTWIRSHVPFRQDPHALELLETPERAIEEIERGASYGLDCDGMVILAGALLQVLGHPIRLVLTGNQSGRYDHIYLEAYSRMKGDWVPVDLAMPAEGVGWQLSRPAMRTVVDFDASDLIPGPWLEESSGPIEISPETIGRHPADYQPGQVVVTPDGGVWSREGKHGQEGYFRRARQTRLPSLGQIRQKYGRPFEVVGREEPEVAPGRLFEREPGTLPGLQIPRIDYSRENQYLFILLTQPNVNQVSLRRVFGFARPPVERARWRNWLRHYREKQAEQDFMTPDQVKVPDPGFLDGNSASQMWEHYEHYFPDEPAPIIPEDAPTGIEEFMPGSHLIPNPDEFGFSFDLWGSIVSDYLADAITLQDLMQFNSDITGEIVSKELYGTDLARETIIPKDMIREALARAEVNLNLGQILEAIAGIIMAITALVGLIWAIVKEAGKEVRQISEPVAAAWTDFKTGLDDAGKTINDAKKAAEAFRTAAESKIRGGRDWLKDFGNDQVESMELAVAIEALDLLYKTVRRVGFDAAPSRRFRAFVIELAEKRGMFYVIAKERVLRDLKNLKEMALEGRTDAEEAYLELGSQMIRAGGAIEVWALEYSELSWDLDHINIPGIPNPEPPDELPEGRYPYTDADDDTGNPYIPDDDVLEGDFWDGLRDEQDYEDETGNTWPGAGQETGRSAEDEFIRAAKPEEIEKTWIARHPILTAGSLAALGVGGYYGWALYGQAIKARIAGRKVQR